jgi:glutamyl-tRNA synthetase
MNGLKQRSKTLLELRDISAVYTNDFNAVMLDESAAEILKSVLQKLESLGDWTEASLEAVLRQLAQESGISFGKMAQVLRNVLTGARITPSIFEMLWVFGRKESMDRIRASLF